MNEVVTPLEQNEHGEMLPGRLPPTAQELIGNDMLWLIAKLCHELNKAFCAQVCGDYSHKHWDEAPEAQRKSCYEGVMVVYENPDIDPKGLHDAWMTHKVAEGWVHGNMKSEEAKTHPNLIPWHQLHVHEQMKDILFLTTCNVMLGGAK